VFLPTGIQLIEEGMFMEHCLGAKRYGYLHECRRGNFAIYAVSFDGERATVCLRQKGGWVSPEEYSGRNNANVTEKMKNHILQTIDDFNLNTPRKVENDNRFQTEFSF
jgi:hypothetical protein